MSSLEFQLDPLFANFLFAIETSDKLILLLLFVLESGLDFRVVVELIAEWCGVIEEMPPLTLLFLELIELELKPICARPTFY